MPWYHWFLNCFSKFCPVLPERADRYEYCSSGKTDSEISEEERSKEERSEEESEVKEDDEVQGDYERVDHHDDSSEEDVAYDRIMGMSQPGEDGEVGREEGSSTSLSVGSTVDSEAEEDKEKHFSSVWDHFRYYKDMSTSNSDVIYFRGDLRVTVKGASNLPNADGRNLKLKFDSLLFNKEKKKDLSDPYVSISIDRHKILQTKVIKDDLNPVWNETFETEVSHEGERLYFWVWDDDMVGKEKLGHAHIPIKQIIEKKVLKEKLQLLTPFKNAKPVLDIEVHFAPVTDVVGEFEVTRCYFPLRHTGDVRLYQDACCHHLQGHSQISVHGSPFSPAKAWSDIAESINRAQKFIYITGWSMTHSIRLERDQLDRPSLGDLLKEKANQGVKVLVLLWDEPFNSENEMMSGVVGTNDEITRVFFSKTKVKCVLASRQKSKRGMVETLVSNTSYSHHQKTVICDESTASCGTVAYLGGLDLTIGRYDDQNHSLFESTKEVHSDDFYQTFPGILKPTDGPRQPWHDVHARVTGEAALDVMTNFSERWKIESPKDVHYLAEQPEETKEKGKWRVQIFRSIPIDAAKFEEHKKHTLSSKHGRLYEASIHRAYVTGVRNSDRFLYVENQYFLGSAHSWLDRDIDVGQRLDMVQSYLQDSKLMRPFSLNKRPRCNHLIPVEIAEQVCEMIHKGRRFAAYILIPLFPEGNPHAAHIQEILYWQAKTISMMYKKIARAIEKAGVAAEPTDYLNFFCLGKREKAPACLNLLTDETPATKMARNGRAMIYVHSKAMVVDDIYAVVGSANINQRSMDGRRDTEIAVGCFETGESEADLITDGQVQGLRKSLWSEHLGRYEPIFDEPESLECVRRVRQLAESNWDAYVKNKTDSSEHPGHLLLYPVRVRKDGDIKPNTMGGFFPDTTAPILGTKSSYLPSRLTV